MKPQPDAHAPSRRHSGTLAEGSARVRFSGTGIPAFSSVCCCITGCAYASAQRRSTVPQSPEAADRQIFDLMLGALARFSTTMIETYTEHRESIPKDAQDAFDRHLLDWHAVSTEMVVYEPIVRGGQVDAAA